MPTSLGSEVVARWLAIYQKWISPIYPATCRFHPSCSEYAREAVLKWGVLKGLGKAGLRILRCHPFNPGGYDPVEGKG